MNRLLKVMLGGFLQPFLVTVQVLVLGAQNAVLIFIVGFLINKNWTLNVKRIAIGTSLDGNLYSVGGAMGALAGFYTYRLGVYVIGLIPDYIIIWCENAVSCFFGLFKFLGL